MEKGFEAAALGIDVFCIRKNHMDSYIIKYSSINVKHALVLHVAIEGSSYRSLNAVPAHVLQKLDCFLRNTYIMGYS